MAIIEVSTISEEPPLWLRNFTNSDGFYLFPAEYLWRFGAGAVLYWYWNWMVSYLWFQPVFFSL